MASKMSWVFYLALAAQYPAACPAQQAMNGAPQSPWIIVVKPGQTAAEAVLEAKRAHEFARYPAAEAAVLLHPTTQAPAGGSGYPRVSAGEIVSPTLNVATAPGLAPEIEIWFHAPAGLLYTIATFTSPHGQTLDSPYYYAGYKPPTHSSLTFQASQPSGARLYAEPGLWTLTSLEIVDLKYQATTYSAKKLAKLFPETTINVINNGAPDFTPPTISAGEILTHRVNLANPNAAFKANLSATDAGSGVATPIIVVNTSKTQQYAYQASQVLPLPSNGGTFDITIPSLVFAAFPGEWYVVAYGATDVAGNMFFEDRPEKVKAAFGDVRFLVGSF
jgi:hypothetical protein